MTQNILQNGNGPVVENDMEKNILIINIGSSSKKYHLYSGDYSLFEAQFEYDNNGFVVKYFGEETKEINSEIFENSLSHFYQEIQNKGFINDSNLISVIGFRLVAPGEYFTKDHIIDKEFLEKLDVVAKSDPAHIAPAQKEIDQINKLFPNTKIVAVSDSSFHNTMPEVAHVYAIPTKIAQEKDIYRFGYHGISMGSIVHDFRKKPQGIENRVVICHLGSGVSVAAILNGKSVDTSMGYSPLEGLVMSSRVGNIDAGAVLCLTESQSARELQKFFYSQCGLLALSGLSGDMRVLLNSEKDGHQGAHLAVESFIYSIRKYIGAYSAVLGGVDAVIFSGTMGERSNDVRERICCGFDYLNIHLDSEKNKNVVFGDDISKNGSVHIYVMHCDEAGEISRRTAQAVK